MYKSLSTLLCAGLLTLTIFANLNPSFAANNTNLVFSNAPTAQELNKAVRSRRGKVISCIPQVKICTVKFNVHSPNQLNTIRNYFRAQGYTVNTQSKPTTSRGR